MNPTFLPTQSRIVRELLWNKGYRDSKEAEAFLLPTQAKFPSHAFPAITHAVSRIQLYIDNDLPIVIWGDFDADGQTSTALLLDMFKILDYTNVSYHIPSRFSNNHGLDNEHIQGIADRYPKCLLITVDCGTNDREEVLFARSLNLEVIITDHHEQIGPLPLASAHINPSTHSLTSPYNGLCGVGVAYILARSLLQAYGCGGMINRLLDLVAIGTIADVAPLTTLNRALLCRGLPILWSGRRLGIQACLKLNDIKTSPQNTEEIAFKIGPMLNAAGRLASANLGVEFLLANTAERALFYAHKLKILNQERQIGQTALEVELETLLPPDTAGASALIIHGEGWHPGLIGLTAGKLANKYGKPAIVITNKGDNMLRASCRSVEGVHILKALETQKEFLEQYGGHAMAAGFIMKKENLISFMKGFMKEMATCTKKSSHTLYYDVEVPFHHLDTSFGYNATINQLELLAPFSQGNKIPLLLSRNVTIVSHSLLGEDKNHAILTIMDEYGCINTIYWWRCEGVELYLDKKVDIIYTLSRSFFIRPTIRITLESIRICPPE